MATSAVPSLSRIHCEPVRQQAPSEALHPSLPLFKMPVPIWHSLALGVIAGATAGIACHGVLATLIIIPVGFVVGWALPITELKDFFTNDAFYLDASKSIPEKLSIALTKGHLIGLSLFKGCTVLQGVFLGGAIAAGASLSASFSPVILILGLLSFALSLPFSLAKQAVSQLFPYYREQREVLYRSLTRSPPLSQINQEAALEENAPLNSTVIKGLIMIYLLKSVHSLLSASRPFTGIPSFTAAGFLENFFSKTVNEHLANDSESIKAFFKHLLPLMDHETMAELIIKHPQLKDWRFLQECQELHPFRFPEAFTQLAQRLSAEGGKFPENHADSLHSLLSAVALYHASGTEQGDQKIQKIINQAGLNFPDSADLFRIHLDKLFNSGS